jgi:hypothetical protein
MIYTSEASVWQGLGSSLVVDLIVLLLLFASKTTQFDFGLAD